MGKTLILLAIMFFLNMILPAQIINKEPLSERITGYKIEARLETDTKMISGTVDAYWVNKSHDTVPDIRLHLYMNAFRSNQTTYFRERGGSPGNKDSDLGWIDIKSITDINNTDLSAAMQYISPDDGNPEDRTVLRVMLPLPALPGDTVSLKIGFETKLSSFFRRTGYNDNYYFVAQWFPKFGVYEPEGMRNEPGGAWNCHQFHYDSEFYSDHSVYEVSINTPADYILGSGGLLMSEKETGEGRKIHVYRAEDIVDFAWTAWPGYQVVTEQWRHVSITLLIPKDRKNQISRQFAAVKYALEYLTDNVGPYPWPYLTFVDPPLKGSGAAGMEYTTLFTSQSSFLMPEWIHLPELVTVHEFGHAYFMGILASNEFEEPWLDEGINSFWELRILDKYYGNNSGLIDHPLLKIPDLAQARIGYISSSNRQAISNAAFSWNYPHNTYYMMSYYKTAIWLHTMMGIVGEETMNNIFREYYKKWAFRHPSGKDFTDVASEVVKRDHGDTFGPDMNWFFDQTLYGTGICDYRVSGITNRKYYKPEGRIDTTGTGIPGRFYSDSLYTATAQLERIGEIMLPVEVLIHFTNGDEILENWDGKGRYKDFAYTGKREIQWVKIDPQFKISMDVNYVNNSKTEDPDRIPVRRLINKLISFIQLYLSIVLL